MPCSPLDDVDDEVDRRVSSDDDDGDDEPFPEDGDDDEPFLTQPFPEDGDDDEPFLTQPPSLHNSVRNAEQLPFLDSVRRTIDNESDFNLRNDVEYTNPPTPPSIVIPDYVSSAIRNELQLTWGCAHPRSYQIEAIFHLVYRKTDMMYLIRKTGEGKSLVMQGMSSMLKGITLTMVPLLGLGSDLESKCTVDNSISVEAYHLDEYRNNHAAILRHHLNQYTREEKSSIVLLVSPQQLTKKSYWYQVLLSLATRGCISSVCIDEAHSTVHNYESFRPEFKTAIDTINYLVSVARRAAPATIYVPILVMSATFTVADQQAFNHLIGRFPSIVLWGDMARRNISFAVKICGQPVTSIMNAWSAKALEQPTKQSLIYSNSAAACDGQLLNRLSITARKIPFDNGKFLALTGDCGLMLKSFLMASFCGDGTAIADTNSVIQSSPENDVTNSAIHSSEDVTPSADSNTEIHSSEDEIAYLPRIWCMPCTSAANCGISSLNCTSCFRLGPPPSWHEMVQEMGRVDRLHDSVTGTSTYTIFLNVSTFISLWLRINSESNISVRDKQRSALFDILRMLILPRQCYHEMIEQHFERPSTYVGENSCNNNCSYCDGTYKSFCGTISKHQLISILTTSIFENGMITATSLVGLLSSKDKKRVKQAIWKGNANVSPGQVHALVLMLLASNLLTITAPSPLSTDKHTPLKSVKFALTKELASSADEFETFSLYNDSRWEGIPIGP